MNYTTKEAHTDNTKIIRVIVVALLSILSIAATAQDCVDTYYLESETISAGKQVTYNASNAIICQFDKRFIVEDKGQATLAAGGRIELNPGFAVLTGGGLFASIANCGQVPPKDPKDPDPTTLVFPNPTDGVINVKATYRVSGARVIDRSGLVLAEKTDINETTFSLDISKAKAGVYVLELNASKQTERIRILKN
jgi:type IX secretion system substrate protein